MSNLCKSLDPIVTAWNNRPLEDGRFPFIIVDALYMKVREDKRVRSRGVLIATGINTDGYREVLGFQVGGSESETTWSELFAWLKRRGLKSLDLITSDSHGSLVSAIRKEFQGVVWQRCQTRFMPNILDADPKRCKREYVPAFVQFRAAPDMQTARMLLKQTLSLYESQSK